MINNKYIFIIVIILMCICVAGILRCGLNEKTEFTKFYRVKKCYKLNSSIISSTYVTSLDQCANFALDKQAMGFNYSPVKPSRKTKNSFTNCEILNCPDLSNLTYLVNDTKFDYFSLFGNTESINNGSCVPNIGIFQLFHSPENYTRAANICSTAGGQLADPLTDARTTGLAGVVKMRITDWYKAAYVGLNDIEREGLFVNPQNEPLNCYTYRAWAPGHPRPKKKRDDCVILDAEKVWRAVNCAKKLPFLCEVFPKEPFWKEFQEFNGTDCRNFRNRTMKRKCKKVKTTYKKAQKPIKYRAKINHKRCKEDI